MTCPDLCTAAKCQELENRISALEQALELLEASFNAHVSQNVPEAHEIDGTVDVSLNLSENQLSVDVNVEPIGTGNDSVRLDYCTVEDCDRIEKKIDNHMTLLVPTAHEIDTSMNVNVDINDNILRVQVELQDIAVNSDTATLPVPEIPEYQEPDLSNYCLIEDCDRIEKKIDNHITLPIPTAHQINSNVNVDLTLTDSNLRVQVEVEDIGVNSDTVSLDSLIKTVFVTEEVREEVNCDELENLINNRLNIIGNAIEFLGNEVENLENLINQQSNDINNIGNDTTAIRNVVEVDVIGTIEQGKCSVEGTDQDGNPITVDAHYETEETNGYIGKGFLALNEAISLIDRKITAVHNDVCLGHVEPQLELDLSEYAPQLCEESLPKREDFTSESSWFEAMKVALSTYISNTTLRNALLNLGLSPTGAASFAITAGASTMLQHLIGNTFKQETIAYNDVCRKLDELEQQDVVSLVATEKHIPYISNKQLILHLVRLEDYPQRKSSSLWQVQIPAAKDEYSWDNFRYLIKCSGNQYAELQFNESYASVSGWFKNVEKANEYFDAVLSLTTATEKNRVYPVHKTPRTNVAARILRPYRAFITRLNANGQSECLAKYAPPHDEDNSNYDPTC